MVKLLSVTDVKAHRKLVQLVEDKSSGALVSEFFAKNMENSVFVRGSIEFL